MYDLSDDEYCSAIIPTNFNYLQLRYERVIVKVFAHYSIPLEINNTIRQIFRSKLRRMGMQLTKLGSKSRLIKLNKWKDGKESNWNFVVDGIKLNQQLLHQKQKIEVKLDEEILKRKKCEEEVLKLQKTIQQQTQESSLKRHTRKPLSEVSRQQQYNRKKQMATTVKKSLTCCENEAFQPCSLELKDKDTGDQVILDVNKGTFAYKDEVVKTTNTSDQICSTLYVKDKFSISNEAYHELSMMSDLPSLSQIKKLTVSLNSQCNIQSCPNEIIGVQQSIRARITQRLTQFVRKAKKEAISIPTTIRIKLTGDGTRIARGLNIVNFAFTILEEGNKGYSVLGNYTIAILKITESYDELALGLQDIYEEAKDLEVLTIEGNVYKILFFLGGDWKFLATVCGIESASTVYSCIWCKCPKSQRSNMDLEWSISDPTKGARTIEEIKEKSKLSKRSKLRFSCCRDPLFPFIPIKRVVIDSLHLFLRITDVLINLLIRDLRIYDGITKALDVDEAPINNYTKSYEKFLNTECKIRFKWNVDRDSKEITYRDLTGPEKVRLFKNINIASQFPALPKAEQIGQLWADFFSLNSDINKDECEADELSRKIKSWVKLFITTYQSKDVTPYIHAFSMHVPEFVKLYGNIISFTQQGLEKLNDVSTKQFQRASNHRNIESLRQMLEKRNRIESLEDSGHARAKKIQTCSKCKMTGHNKRSCKIEV